MAHRAPAAGPPGPTSCTSACMLQPQVFVSSVWGNITFGKTSLITVLEMAQLCHLMVVTDPLWLPVYRGFCLAMCCGIYPLTFIVAVLVEQRSEISYTVLLGVAQSQEAFLAHYRYIVNNQ